MQLKVSKIQNTDLSILVESQMTSQLYLIAKLIYIVAFDMRRSTKFLAGRQTLPKIYTDGNCEKVKIKMADIGRVSVSRFRVRIIL